MIGKTSFTYPLNSGDRISNSELYYYNQKGQVQYTERIKSNGDVTGLYMIYPLDYLDGNDFVKTMVDSNVIAVPIETITTLKKNGLSFITEGYLNLSSISNPFVPTFQKKITRDISIPLPMFKFSNQITGMIPQNTEKTSYSPDSRYENFYSFNRYDSKNNILERQKTNDFKEVYLWGYNGQYPVVKVIGSSYDAVIQKLPQSNIDAATALANNDASVRALLGGSASRFRAIPRCRYGRTHMHHW